MDAETEMEIFSRHGPSFLTNVDWSNSHHRRSVAASLVQGVYSLERDRRENRQGAQALAPPWWQHFNFELVEILVDNHDVSIFGGVFEFVDFPHCLHHLRPPHYVVAFRGTSLKAGHRKEDLKLDLHHVFNDLRRSSRFQIGIETATQIVTQVGAGNIWLAGHSLGSSMALVVGREMVKQFGIHLETYLFNSPFISLPIEWLRNDKIKLGVRLMNSVITAGFAAAANHAGVKKNKDVEADPFEVLSTWTPYLFINPSDPISMEYVGYFKHREDMKAIGAGRIGRLATQNYSIGTILSCAAGKEREAVHLIPSAYLTITVTPLRHFREAHGLYQWWRQDLQFDYKNYQFK